jgi:hypothetical protein
VGPIGEATRVSISKAFTILDQGPAIGSWAALEGEGMGSVVEERLWAMVEAGVTQEAEGFIIWKRGVGQVGTGREMAIRIKVFCGEAFGGCLKLI